MVQQVLHLGQLEEERGVQLVAGLRQAGGDLDGHHRVQPELEQVVARSDRGQVHRAGEDRAHGRPCVGGVQRAGHRFVLRSGGCGQDVLAGWAGQHLTQQRQTRIRFERRDAAGRGRSDHALAHPGVPQAPVEAPPALAVVAAAGRVAVEERVRGGVRALAQIPLDRADRAEQHHRAGAVVAVEHRIECLHTRDLGGQDLRDPLRSERPGQAVPQHPGRVDHQVEALPTQRRVGSGHVRGQDLDLAPLAQPVDPLPPTPRRRGAADEGQVCAPELRQQLRDEQPEPAQTSGDQHAPPPRVERWPVGGAGVATVGDEQLVAVPAVLAAVVRDGERPRRFAAEVQQRDRRPGVLGPHRTEQTPQRGVRRIGTLPVGVAGHDGEGGERSDPGQRACQCSRPKHLGARVPAGGRCVHDELRRLLGQVGLQCPVGDGLEPETSHRSRDPGGVAQDQDPRGVPRCRRGCRSGPPAGDRRAAGRPGRAGRHAGGGAARRGDRPQHDAVEFEDDLTLFGADRRPPPAAGGVRAARGPLDEGQQRSPDRTTDGDPPDVPRQAAPGGAVVQQTQPLEEGVEHGRVDHGAGLVGRRSQYREHPVAVAAQ